MIPEVGRLTARNPERERWVCRWRPRAFPAPSREASQVSRSAATIR